MRVTYQATMQAWSRNEHLSPITVTQDDALSRYLQITIIDMSGLPVDLSGAVVNVHFSKADKTVVYSASTVLNAIGGQIEVALTTQVTAIAKPVTVTVQVVSAEGPTLFVRGLSLDVQPCNVTGSVESSNEFTALTDALATVGGLDGRIADVEDTEISGHRLGDGNFDLSTDDMKSGTLPVARGGTGKSNWIANQLLYPTSPAAFSQLPSPTVENSFLAQGTSGAPVWKSPADAAFAMLGESSGTWTPKITNGRTGATITYVSDGCTYYRIGKILVCSYDVYIDTIPSGATDLMYVSGLPGTPVVGHAAAGLYWYRLNISIVSLNVTVEPAGFFFWRTTAAADTNGNPLTSNNLKPGGTAAGTRLRGTLFMLVS